VSFIQIMGLLDLGPRPSLSGSSDVQYHGQLHTTHHRGQQSSRWGKISDAVDQD
jgi:hypothetical protein